MKYQGSKARIAKYISPIINRLIEENGIKNIHRAFCWRCKHD